MSFVHAVDRSTIPTVNILGVNIAAVDMDWLLRFTNEHFREISGDYITVANVHTTVMANEDDEYRAIQNGGMMAIPDGGPLATAGRKRGAPDMRRTPGPSYMMEMLKNERYRHYFYGSTRETLDKMREKLKREFPQAVIAGMYSPPFRELTTDEDHEIVARINEANPDFVWVGLGAPKQEKWMARHQGRIKGVMIGVGAGFDYFAGNIRRAPQWMQKANMEWLYRLIQDPKRLFKRYLVTNTKFVWNVVIRGK